MSTDKGQRSPEDSHNHRDRNRNSRNQEREPERDDSNHNRNDNRTNIIQNRNYRSTQDDRRNRDGHRDHQDRYRDDRRDYDRRDYDYDRDRDRRDYYDRSRDRSRRTRDRSRDRNHNRRDEHPDGDERNHDNDGGRSSTRERSRDRNDSRRDGRRDGGGRYYNDGDRSRTRARSRFRNNSRRDERRDDDGRDHYNNDSDRRKHSSNNCTTTTTTNTTKNIATSPSAAAAASSAAAASASAAASSSKVSSNIPSQSFITPEQILLKDTGLHNPLNFPHSINCFDCGNSFVLYGGEDQRFSRVGSLRNHPLFCFNLDCHLSINHCRCICVGCSFKTFQMIEKKILGDIKTVSTPIDLSCFQAEQPYDRRCTCCAFVENQQKTAQFIQEPQPNNKITYSRATHGNQVTYTTDNQPDLEFANSSKSLPIPATLELIDLTPALTFQEQSVETHFMASNQEEGNTHTLPILSVFQKVFDVTNDLIFDAFCCPNNGLCNAYIQEMLPFGSATCGGSLEVTVAGTMESTIVKKNLTGAVSQRHIIAKAHKVKVLAAEAGVLVDDYLENHKGK